MIRATGRYQDQSVELDMPLELRNGTEVEVVVRVKTDAVEIERTELISLGMSRLEEEWDNPEDAVYDNWRELYGL